MGVLKFSKVCALLLVASLGVDATPVAQVTPRTEKVLRAATRRSDLFRRSMRLEPKFETELVFIEEENPWNGGSVFASQVKVVSKKPVLNLEEVEHHLTDVHCGDSKIQLYFVDTVSATDARMACHGSEGGLVVTSHDGCNREGERAVYQVHDASFAGDGTALELSVVKSLWKESFDRFEVSFGHTADEHSFRRHSDFAKVRRKRQDAASITAPPVAIPTDTPDNVQEVTFDLKWLVDNKTFSPTDFTAGLPAGFIPLPDLSNLPLEIGCKTCSTNGELIVSQGSIVIDANQIDVVPDFLQGGDDGKSISSVITGGFLELKANNMEGSFELFARPKANGSFMITLFSLPVLGFTIPGVGRAGAVFEASLSAEYQIEGDFGLTYGMNLIVPTNSSIRVELTDITRSGVNGFPDATLKPLPFSFDVQDVSAFVSLALVPTIPVGFQFEDALDASISVGMELPRLDALISTIANADTNCNNLDTTADMAARSLPSRSLPPRQDEAPFANVTQPTNSTNGTAAVGPLVLIEANVSITVDVGFDLRFPLLPAPLDGVSTSAQIFSTLFPLSSQCLAPLAGFAPATEVYNPVQATTTVPAGANGTVVATPSATSNSTLNRETTIPSQSFVYPTAGMASAGQGQCGCRQSTTTVYLAPGTSALVTLPPYGNRTAPPPPPPSSTSTSTDAPSNVITPPAGQFSGAAVPSVLVPSMQWGSLGWQLGLLGASVFVGMLML